MSRRFTRKRVVAVVGVVAALAIAATAFAYWTTTGSGTGTGTVSSDTARTITGTVASGLTPGGSETVTLTANKDANTTYKVGAITGVVTVGNAYDPSTNPTGCKAGDFHFTGPSADETVPAGSGTFTLTSGTLAMDNTAANQDGCKNASISIALTAAGPATP